jgi:hypothetical protein
VNIRLTGLAATATAVVVGVVAPAALGATTYSDTVKGVEVAASSTQGTFVGTASGALPGDWAATIDHTPLSSSGATITGGSFSLTTVLGGYPTLVTGSFTGGTVTVLAPGYGCRNQKFAIDGSLGDVGPWYGGSGTGGFSGTLTHYRQRVFGSCVTYAASVTGSLVVTF